MLAGGSFGRTLVTLVTGCDGTLAARRRDGYNRPSIQGNTTWHAS